MFLFKMSHSWLFIVSWYIILIFSCSTSVSLNIDKEEWMKDYDGCSGYRMDVYDKILKEKDHLLGLSTGKILEILGNPNMNQLYKRNQKFFVYQISPGSACPHQDTGEELFLIFRFNAMGLTNEIYLNDEFSPTE
jgi:hypothetical protein